MRALCGVSTILYLAVAGFGGGASADSGVFVPLGSGANALDGYLWKKRPVVLFAPSQQDPTYREAITELEAASADLRERDIVVLSDTDPEVGSALRQKLDPTGFLMLLVGKDGGIKLRSDAVIPVATLIETIDAMPMRQREMRQD